MEMQSDSTKCSISVLADHILNNRVVYSTDGQSKESEQTHSFNGVERNRSIEED